MRIARKKGAAVNMEHFQAALDPRKQELLEARFIGARNSVDFTEQMDAEESFLDEDEVDEINDFQSPVTEIRPKRKTKTDAVNSFHCMKTLIDVVTKRDQYSVYGEHIAHKLRNCKRDSMEIDIAQHHLDNILFNLSMGAYSQEASKSKTAEFLDTPSGAVASTSFNHV